MVADRLHLVNDRLACDEILDLALKFHFVYDGLKRKRLSMGQTCHDLTVELDVRPVVERINESGVRHAVFTDACINVLDPESADGALLYSAVSVSILLGFVHLA